MEVVVEVQCGSSLVWRSVEVVVVGAVVWCVGGKQCCGLAVGAVVVVCARVSSFYLF